MSVLETQRATLGAAVVDPALAALRQQLAALETEVPAQSGPLEERRVITILFTDIVGSTALAHNLDPEEWRQTVAKLHSAIGTIIQGHHGMVAQYLGDGLLALFGAEASGERDPEHAILAALGAQSAITAWNGAPPIQIRVGIHTGLVVVGELGSDAKREFTATGDAMNVAARLQSAAPPGGILISHDTYQHVRGVFSVTPQPPLAVKGAPEPIQTYLVRRAKSRPFRTLARGVAGVQTRTIGRDRELRALQAAYLDAVENRRLVWAQLVGDAGIGKSRLLDDVREWVELRPEVVRLFRARAYADDARQPFSLVRRMWFDRFQIAEDAPIPQAEAKWVQRFQELSKTDAVEPAHALGLLVGLPFAESPHIGAMRGDPVQVKGRGLVVSREVLKMIRREQPVEFLLEDLQWADASSWEYLVQVLLADAPSDEGAHGTFVLAAARPEWTPPEELLRHPRYVSTDLQPLSDEATRELVSELLRAVEHVPEDVVRLIVERCEGVPYFVEEVVNWFLDRGIIDRTRDPWGFVSARLRETPLPATLQHLLFTRLSVLNDAERLVLLAREEVLGILGEPDAWRVDVAELLELAESLDDDARRAEVYHRQAEYARKTGDHRAGLRAADEAIAAARRAGNPSIEVRALSLKVPSQTRLGELNAAGQTAEEALRRAHDLGDETTLALTLSNVAIYYTESGDVAQALVLHRQEVEIWHRLGNRAQEARGLVNTGVNYWQLGLYKLARMTLEQALELAGGVGARRSRAYALQNLGYACFRLHDGRTARRVLEQSLGEMVAVNDAYGRAGAVTYLGFVLEQSSDAAGAARRFAEAIGIFTDLGGRAAVVEVSAGLARCALAQAHLDEARQYAADIWDYLEAHGTRGMYFPVWVYQSCAEVFDALNEPDRARKAAEAGHRELMARAAEISDPDWRRAFLENVAENRAIVEMWEELAR